MHTIDVVEEQTVLTGATEIASHCGKTNLKIDNFSTYIGFFST